MPEQKVMQTGAWCVQVWLVKEYNDAEDIRLGGSPFLGPHMWVLESHKDAFKEKMRERYGANVLSVTEGKRSFRPMDKLPTLEEQLQTFKDFLSDPSNWE